MFDFQLQLVSSNVARTFHQFFPSPGHEVMLVLVQVEQERQQHDDTEVAAEGLDN